MSIDNELKRVLSNPEHVIVSKELSDILNSEEPRNAESQTFLTLDDLSLVCKIVKMKLDNEGVTFTLDVPAFSIRNLLTAVKPLQIDYEDLKYEQIPSSTISWEDNLLTLKTRRIFNEAVQT